MVSTWKYQTGNNIRRRTKDEKSRNTGLEEHKQKRLEAEN